MSKYNWLCKFGLHEWGGWSSKMLYRESTSPFDCYTFKYKIIGKSRRCSKCCLEQTKAL